MLTSLFRTTARAAGTCVAASAVTVALAAGCSSSTPGSGSGGSTGGGTGSATSASAGAPGGGSGGGSGSGSGSGSADFCAAWRHIGDLSKVVGGGGRQDFVARFDELAAEAPPEIKSAVVAIDKYVHQAVSGQVNPSQAGAKLGQAFAKIGKWIVQNCH